MRKLRGIFLFLLFFLAIIFPLKTLADGGGSWYHLPYPNCLRVFLTQGPFSSGNHSGYFAVDFKAEYPSYNLWEPAPVVAARGGWVVFAKDCDDGFTEEEANLLVLGHSPKPDGTYREYSWYVHLKKESIPKYVIVEGYIRAGVKIGLEGHNGLSSGVHLHFCVTDWFDQSFMYKVGRSGVIPRAYQLENNNRIYKTVPFRLFEYEDVSNWAEGNWVGSENVITEVTTDPNEPQP